jgi:hypothetical protein
MSDSTIMMASAPRPAAAHEIKHENGMSPAQHIMQMHIQLPAQSKECHLLHETEQRGICICCCSMTFITAVTACAAAALS